MPGRSDTELDSWLLESATDHSTSIEDVTPKQEGAIIAYAKYLGVQAKALETAENASLSISGKLSIDKSGASGNYEKLLKQAQSDYVRALRGSGLKNVMGGTVRSGSVVRSDDPING